ncbi:MAG: nucleotidyltransferase domain-containing protein [Phocaeicola sp.]|uniref:nucleotidyltransferase domain-containing protein n=1 Tax=Phocaeicola sp. TaxID=2773926 RepID=UPI003F9EED94
MNNTQEKFLQILQAALYPEKTFHIKVDGAEMKELMRMAKKQSVMGLFIDYMFEQNLIKGDLDISLISTLTLTKRKNLLINKEIEDFIRLLNAEHIPAIFVKGQMIASLYPNPALRQPGDVDFYCVTKDRERLTDILNTTMNIELKHSSTRHEEFNLNDVQFEMHSTLIDFADKKHVAYWEELMTEEMAETHYAKVENTRVPTLSPTANAVYLFLHIFEHLVLSGIGLRQFCDWAMLLRHRHEEIDKALVEKHLKALGMTKAFKACGSILVKYLGVSEEEFPLPINKMDQRRGERILKDIFRMGNFGKEIRKVKKRGLLHSLETGWIGAMQSFKFFWLAPKEIMLIYLKKLHWFTRKYKAKC